MLVMGLDLASIGLFPRAANLGGEIRPPEIRAGAPAPAAAPEAEADGDHG